MERRVLVVDDEQDIAEILQFNLAAEGYEVDVAFSAEEALGRIEASQHGYDLILLDVMMGEISGFGLAGLLKRNPRTADIPLIFITALGGETERVKGLDIGADDYIAKPLSVAEVKARCRAVLRRAARKGGGEQTSVEAGAVSGGRVGAADGSYVRHEGVEVEMLTKTVRVNGAPVALTRLEFEVLVFLLRHPGRVFSRDELLHRLWPEDTVVLARTVDVTLARLRGKIKPYGEQIKTKIGYGYYFEG